MAQSTNHDMIKVITPAKESWQIIGRIIYSWEQFWEKGSQASNLDFIIIDSEGSRIQATIAKKFFFKYKSLVKEGDVFYISNFSVSQNTGEYRTTKHPYKIVFTAKTIFNPTSVIIPDPPMEFASFNDILHNNLDAKYLVDVIGELNGKSPVDSTSKDKRTMLIELVDSEGQKLICTLWEKLAEQMANYTCESDNTKHRPIIIIRYAKIKAFKDSNLSNSLCSKLLVDAEIPEVRDFVKRRTDAGQNSSSSMLTHISSHSESIANELLDLSARRTIDEIREIQQEGYFVTLATITAIDTEFRWYIESCRTCRSSVELDDKGKWLCTGKCESYAKSVILRYKVRVKVVDHTGNATFILFDTHATDLIKQSAKQLRDNQIKQENPNEHPSELNVLLNRRFIFKVKVDEKYNLSLDWKSYGVNKLSEDPTLIQKYLETCQKSQKDGLEIDSREESEAPNGKGKESVQSTVWDESVTSSLNITPTKRLLDPSEVEDDAQLSTTKKHEAVKVGYLDYLGK